MQRRDFLKWLSLSSAAACVPSLALRAHAQNSDNYAGPYWVFIHASGGYDPRFMFDPTTQVEQNRLYTGAGNVGKISCADWELDYERWNMDPTTDYGEFMLTPRMFLERRGQQLTVINGIDTRTNNHDSGRRAMASGELDEGYPALGALIASTQAKTLPLAFIGGGGFDATQGLLPVVRLGDVGALRRLAYPNRPNPDDANSRYHSDATWKRIQKAQQTRLDALAKAQTLPALQASIAALDDARSGDDLLKRLVVPELVEVPGNMGDLRNLARQGQLAAAAFKAGVAVSTTLSLGGFDTHGNHDRDQSRQIAKLLGGVHFIAKELEVQGLLDKTYIVVTSDFARGPSYNGPDDGDGKDHWPVSSMFALGPKIAGNRMVGGTNDAQQARAVDPSSLAFKDSGVTIEPLHVHIALRKLAGVDEATSARAFGLAGEDLPLFG